MAVEFEDNEIMVSSNGDGSNVRVYLNSNRERIDLRNRKSTTGTVELKYREHSNEVNTVICIPDETQSLIFEFTKTSTIDNKSFNFSNIETGEMSQLEYVRFSDLYPTFSSKIKKLYSSVKVITSPNLLINDDLFCLLPGLSEVSICDNSLKIEKLTEMKALNELRLLHVEHYPEIGLSDLKLMVSRIRLMVSSANIKQTCSFLKKAGELDELSIVANSTVDKIILEDVYKYSNIAEKHIERNTGDPFTIEVFNGKEWDMSFER